MLLKNDNNTNSLKSDLKTYSLIFKQEGTAQNERNPSALNPAAIAVDDRKLEDFIIYAQRYSKNLLFVSTEDVVDVKQSWEPFFKDDAVLLTAHIAAKDINGVKDVYDFLVNSFQQKSSIENFSKVSDYVFSRFKKIDGWHASSASDTSLNEGLVLYIKSYLGKELRKLNEILAYICNLSKKPFSLNQHLINKNNIWELTEKQTISLGEHFFTGNTDEEKLSNALLYLNRIFDAVFHVTSNIINSCKDYFNASVYRQQNHPPHIALFITFIKLYGFAQAELNKIPQKLLDYYYKEILHIKPKKAIPDQAFVLFEIAKGFDCYKIKKGTLLSAGKDKKNINLAYKTDKDIIVNKSQIMSVKTIFIQKNKTGILNYYAATLKRNGENTASNVLAGNRPWKTFGAQDKAAQAVVGIAIASAQFYLSKGERNVSIIFETKDEIAIKELDIALFKLLLTAEKNWMSSANPEDNVVINHFKKIDDKKLELNFSISIAQPSAVIAFDPDIHAGNFITNQPVLQILLLFPGVPIAPDIESYNVYQNKINQFNFLQTLTIIKTAVKVQAGSINQKVSFDGVRDLILQNHESLLDFKKPFQPFTSMPKVGSSFYIGCNDMFYKKMQSLTVNIEWMLPDNFPSYYDKYFPPYDSNKFIASLSILKDQHWKKLDNISIIDVYANEPKFRFLKIPLGKEADAGAGDAQEDVSKFDISKKNGTLKLKLNFPDFGHDIYPQLITSAVMEKASSKLASADFYKIIKKQLHDSVISIKLPDDVKNSQGSLKVVVYDILENWDKINNARSMMIEGLTNKLKSFNGSNIETGQITKMYEAGNAERLKAANENRALINDDNFVERIIRFLKKVKLIDKSIHFDEDKDILEDAVDNISDRLNTRVDFLLPADHELVALIISETNNAISRIVVKIADKLSALRSTGTPDGNTIAPVLKKEFDDANEVINDLIARKIATLLSAHDVPPKPYTPLINTIAVSYISSKELKRKEDQFFQIMPFGVKEIDPFNNDNNNNNTDSKTVQTATIFPGRLIGEHSNDEKPSGLLLIGIKDIFPAENLSLFFQISEGTRRSDKKPPELNWWYLTNNEWKSLKDNFLISDSTYGLQTTGIMEVSIPGDANSNNTIFDEKGLFWLCVSVAENIDAFPDLADMKAQAISATFEDNDNDPSHVNFPLPPKKINNLVEKLPGIKSLLQPVASAIGKMEECEPEYYARVSERLRHKSRAVNNWDYERLVLDRFPFIYKVKCLNNYCSGRFAIGHVTIVPIVNLTNKSTKGIGLEMPKASYPELRNIEQFVLAKSSPFVKVHAVNPQLDYLKISCKVRFYADADKGYYLKKLNEDIILFLTPWATGNSDAVSFSAKIYASSVISFIDKRDYVDYVADLFMSQYILLPNGTEVYCRAANQTISLVETRYTTGHSILVSAPRHTIELI